MKIKSASRDFNINDLPSNRKEVFFDCIKNRYKYMISAFAYLFLTLVPFLLIIVFKLLVSSSLNESLLDSLISIDEYNNSMLWYNFIYDLLIVLSSFITSIGLSGATRIIRQISWEEPLFFGTDFKDGIKMNYKNIMVHTLLFNFIYLCSDMFNKMDFGIEYINYIPILIFVFIVIPVYFYSIVQTNVYTFRVVATIKNSILLFIKSALVCVLFSLFISIYLFLVSIPNLLILMLIYILSIVFVFPIIYLLFNLYSMYVLDKNINKENYPEIYDKGIVRHK